MVTVVPVKRLEEAPFLDVLSTTYRLDPGRHLDELRRRSWLVRTTGGAMVLGRQQVQLLLSDRRLRSPVRAFIELQGVTDGLLHDRLCQTLLALDGDDHLRVRSLVRAAFTPSAVDRHRPLMRSLATTLAEPLRPAGRCEFMRDVADRYPIQVICRLLGVPSEDHQDFTAWLAAIGWALTLELPTHRVEAEAAMAALDEYIGALLTDRRARPRGDLLTQLVEAERAGDRLSEDELRALVVGLLFAGYDTTRNQLGLAIWIFAQHPEEWRQLAAEPVRAAAAVEEVLRYRGAVALAPRLVEEPIELDGYVLPAGTLLMLSTTSANHDPSVYDCPERFDIAAPRAPQLTFGGGAHYCLGANLARAEMAEALPVLARAFPGVTLDGAPEWRPPMNIWGPARLPIRFDAA